MAGIKRRSEVEDRPVKKIKPSKQAPRSASHNAASAPHPKAKPLQKSLLISEEKAFPRGGASILTPLERKQVQLQAEKDVLFEQAGGKRAPAIDEDAFSDIEREELRKERRQKRPRKVREQAAPVAAVDAPVVKIHGLSFYIIFVV